MRTIFVTRQLHIESERSKHLAKTMFLKNIFQAKKMVSPMQDTIFALGRLIFNAYILFWLSALLYGTFNYYYLPVAYQEHPVYFHFKVCENGMGICSFPEANLSLVKQESQLEVFKRGQSYRIVLEMELPESNTNKEVGMFMMEMKLYNRAGENVHSAVRSTSIQHKSVLLETLETLCFAPFFLFGYMSQKQTVPVVFFPNFVEHTYNRAVGAIVQIQSHQMQLYAAKLSIFSQFSGIRYFLYYFPITSAIIGISWIFTLLSSVVLLSWYQFRQPKTKAVDDTVLASIDMPWKRQDERREDRALMSPDEMTHEDLETIGARSDADVSEETSLLSTGSILDSGVRLRNLSSES